jgi:hypothetical protein
LVIAGRGRFLRRFWGWAVAAALVATQIVGSVVNAILGGFREGATGAILAGAILNFLFRPRAKGIPREGFSRAE